jgi:DNA-binding GntR family transcriptional regulator
MKTGRRATELADEAATDPPPEPRARKAVLSLETLRLLERKIIRMELAPGLKLAEEDLCRDYGVSRSPLREALRLLEASGLAVRAPRQGVRVAPMSLENLDHLFACRLPLEALAAESIIDNPCREEAIQLVEQALAAMRASFATGDREGCFDANVNLTNALHEGADNAVLRPLLALVDKPALRYRYLAYATRGDLMPASIELNGALVAAIRDGDRKRTAQLTCELIARAWKIIRAAFIAHAAPAGVVAGEADRAPIDLASRRKAS